MSDPQEAATPSDPHSAEAEEREAWAAFVAGHASRDAEVTELRADKDRWHGAALIGLAQESDLEREVAELKKRVRNLLGEQVAGIAFMNQRDELAAEVAELKAKIADAWDEGAQIGGRSAFFQTPNPYRSASSPVEGGN